MIKKGKAKKIYVKNKDLREQLIISKEQDVLTAKALDMFILMANRFFSKFLHIFM